MKVSTVVSKFGGSSLADSGQFRKVRAIVRANHDRQIIVVSAPGARFRLDQKVTDMLYSWHREVSRQIPSNGPDEFKNLVYGRFEEIIQGLDIEFDLESEFIRLNNQPWLLDAPDYIASRGEYLNAKILAKFLGYEFIDAVECIRFDSRGNYVKDYALLQRVLQGKKVVIPGFYGAMADGSIKTFSRGGSDITGAIVAAAMGAQVYENWTDVSGLRMADPRIVRNPRAIERLTYGELRELAYMGATVFHEEAMFPTNIRNTNAPNEPGTLVTLDATERNTSSPIVGIAGKRGFTGISVAKALMNQEVGFVRRILSVLENNGISFEHQPSGIDTVSVIIEDSQLTGPLDIVLASIRAECNPDEIKVCRDIAMIAVVGRSMIHACGVAAKVFTAIAHAGINIRTINQDLGEMTIIIGVEGQDYEQAIRSIYSAFVEN